jgi:Holliday junction resolvase
MSGKAHKAKGDRLERAVVNLLKAHGLEAHRVPLSGSVAGYPGDVVVKLADREWILECKSRKEFKTLYGWLEQRDALILKGDRREPLVVMRLQDLLNEMSPKGGLR